MAYFEELVYQAINYKHRKDDGIRDIVRKTVKNKDPINNDTIRYVLVMGVVFIIFSCTDKYKNALDKKVPFRNNILHRGILDYSPGDLDVLYRTLVYFAAELSGPLSV